MLQRSSGQVVRRGAIAPFSACLMVVLLAMVAFAIDIGYIASTRTQQQAAADSAAVAAASQVIANLDVTKQSKAREVAERFARTHQAGQHPVRLDPTTDVEFGWWDTKTRTFLAPRATDKLKINAVRVRVHRDSANTDGQLKLFFGPVVGVPRVNVEASAIALIPTPVVSRKSPGVGTRFLIDEDMIDTDVPSIERLAQQMGKDTEWLVSAKNEKSPNPADWFLNIPAGSRLELPTGQVGDEALFDINATLGKPSLPQWPFQTAEQHYKFMMYNETSETDPVSQLRNAAVSKDLLDPLHGVGRFNQPSLYPELVNPDFIHVSPVWKSDISALDGIEAYDPNAGPDINRDGQVDGHTTNKAYEKGVNGLGYRRGLLAFKIVGFRIDPEKPYPYLPNLIIEVVSANSITLPSVLPATPGEETYTAGGVRNVRLAR